MTALIFLKQVSLWAAAGCLLAAHPAFAIQERVLHSFTDNPDGAHPIYGLVAGRSGNLYGTTSNGGSSFEGDVIELSPSGHGDWAYSVIYNFADCNSGCYPHGVLTLDDAGHVYGATALGGTNNNGTIFELTPHSDGSWSEAVLYSFGAEGSGDGSSPNGVIYFKGKLYGTTSSGGKYQGGTVFAAERNSSGKWSEVVLHSFKENFVDGGGPMGGVTLDAKGNIYGTTSMGGSSLAGTVFELNKDSGGIWTEHILHSFNVTDGLMPWFGSLIFDKQGNIYGTTSGGGSGNYGTVFELSHSGTGWTETVLHNFTGGEDGAGPNAGVVMDAEGRLYGTTNEGGGRGVCTNPHSTTNVYCGTVFLLTPSGSGSWAESFLHRFANSSDGGEPSAALVLDSSDHSYGVTSQGGTAGAGVIFELNHPALQ